jgi:dihydrodipicolinate synthase/N-acetylneuraminate lyase
MELHKPLRGVITAMITPLRGRDVLDHAGLERLIEHLIAGGVHGLFILGTTGEAPGLSYRLRTELIERTCKQVAERLPVIVGITDTAFVEAANLATSARKFGAQAVVASAPYYFPASQVELLDFVEHLAAEVPLPLLLYNAPTNTGHTFEPSTVLRAADVPNVIGLKDSGGNMTYFHSVVELLKGRPDFTLLVGPEELLAEAVLLGAHGGMCGGSNFYPQLFVRLYEAAVARDFEQIRILHSRVMQISTTIYRVGRYESSYLKGLKCAVSLLGLAEDFMAEPFRPFDSPERAKVSEYMADQGLLLE